MIEEIEAALADYREQWHAFQAEHAGAPLLARVRPTAVGWKIADYETYQQAYNGLRRVCDLTVETYMNDRWIAKLHIVEPVAENVSIIKLIQRRPQRDDALGLDHVDFLIPPKDDIDVLLASEPGLEWRHETNGPGEGWISLSFGDKRQYEAKLKRYTVLERAVGDLWAINATIAD